MTSVAALCGFLERFAPLRLAEDWDNVGLLVGDRSQQVSRIMTCLTVTPETVAEAVRENVDMLITHHPAPFRPLKKITTDNTAGRLLLDLIRAGVAVYSPHTCFDSAEDGINQQLAVGLGLTEIVPLQPETIAAETSSSEVVLGSGRWGKLPQPRSMSQLIAALKDFLAVDQLHLIGDETATVSKVAVACGAAGGFLSDAKRIGCELFVTGETNFHSCLEAESLGVQMLLPGHYATERFAVENLADTIGKEFDSVEVWASRDETDPVKWV